MNNDPFQALQRQGFHVSPVHIGRLSELVDMFNRTSQHVIGEDEFTLEEYMLEYQAPGFDLEQSTRVVYSPKNAPVGVIEIWDNESLPVHPFIWAVVDPTWEGRGIGTAMMTWALERGQHVLSKVPQELRVSVRSAVTQNYPPAKGLLEHFGMQPIRHYHRMVVRFVEPPPPPVWPDGISLRRFDPESDAEAVYRAENEAFRDHWGHVELPFDEGFEQWKHYTLQHPDFDASLWYIAMDGDDIAGLATCKDHRPFDPQMGWVSILAVRRPWRRQGLGLALLNHAFNMLHKRGKSSVGLGVDSTSLTGATDLYEKAGMCVERTTTSYELELRGGIERMTQNVSR